MDFRSSLEGLWDRNRVWPLGLRILSVVVGIGFLLALFLIAGSESLAVLAAPSLLEMLGVLGILLLLMMISTKRWKILTELFLDIADASFSGYFRSFAVARAVGLFLPQGLADFGVRPAMQQVTQTSSAASAFAGVLLERLLDATLLIALAVSAAPFLFGALGEQGFLLLCSLMLGLWTILFLGLTPVTLRLLTKLVIWFSVKFMAGSERFKKLSSDLDAASEILAANLTSVAPLRQVAFLSILRLGLILLQLWLLASALGLDQIDALILLAAIPLGQLGTLIALTPGGLGFVEGGLLASFYALGVDSNQALAFVLGQRLYLGAFVIFLGIASVVFLPASASAQIKE